MKILVTASYGQLGRSLFNRLNSHSEIFWTGRDIPFNGNGFYLDICDRVNLKELINLNEPDIIINLAALTNVDFCEKNSDLAREINTNGVRNICDAFKGKIVHLSTDYVFDGKKGPYVEEDEVSPLSVYGKTKLIIEDILKNLYKSQPKWKIINLRYFNPIGAHSTGIIGEDSSDNPTNLIPYITEVALKKRINFLYLVMTSILLMEQAKETIFI